MSRSGAGRVDPVKHYIYLRDGYDAWTIKSNAPPSQGCVRWGGSVLPWANTGLCKGLQDT